MGKRIINTTTKPKDKNDVQMETLNSSMDYEKILKEQLEDENKGDK